MYENKNKLTLQKNKWYIVSKKSNYFFTGVYYQQYQ